MRKGSITSQVLEKIQNMSHDQVFVAADFLDLGEYNTVRQALLRLKNAGKIQNVMRGVYYRPRYCTRIQSMMPPHPANVAGALARKFNWNIAPCEETALSQVGLISQPMVTWKYVSDGPYYKCQIGILTLEFKHRNSREISGMSTSTALIIQVLKALGRENITESELSHIRLYLTDEEKTQVRQEAKQSTVWIYETVRRICN